MASDTFAVRLTDSNKDHDTPREVMQNWLSAGYEKQTILIYALYALAKVPVPHTQAGAERQAVNRLMELVPRLERALARLESGQIAVATASPDDPTLAIDDNFLDSIASYFDSTQ